MTRDMVWRDCPHVRWSPGDRFACFTVTSVYAPDDYPRLLRAEVRDRADAAGLRVVDPPHLCKIGEDGRERWLARLATPGDAPTVDVLTP